MPTLVQTADCREMARQLAALADDSARLQFLNQNPSLQDPAAVEKLSEEIPGLAQVDIDHADRVAQATAWLAERLNDDFSRAHSLRAVGNVLFLRGKHPEALDHYEAAERLFSALGDEIEVARTLSTSLQSLIFIGQFEQAFTAVARAQEVFEKHGERLRLARLHNNLGNVLYRLDRIPESLDAYLRAYDGLQAPGGDPEAVAAVLHNLAVCYISLNRFPDALHAYERAREHCQRHNLLLLMAQADYNIAYLYYLRGEYVRAIELYSATRRLCDKLGDHYHKALCDLDESEMYIELNLSEEGSQLAQQAFAGFEDLGMGYEAAKALANLAISVSRQGKAFQALELFARSRELFVRQQNHLWPSLIDLYVGLVQFQEGRDCEARLHCEAALQFFSGTPLASKMALCELLLARLDLRIGETSSARTRCLSALERLKLAEAPALDYQAYFVLGQIEEALGDRPASFEAYRQAHVRLENLRSHLNQEELKIAFLKDKLSVYESLVWMCLGDESEPGSAEAAFGYIEQAKSRSLADLIAFRAHALPAPTDIRSDLVEQVRDLREELNWYYRQIDLEGVREESRSTQRVDELRRRTRDCEEQLKKLMGDMKGVQSEFTNLQGGAAIDLSTIREAIPEDAVLLEYYSVRDILCACILDRRRLEIIPLIPKSRIRDLLRMLNLQLAKFHLGEGYTSTFSQTLLASTQAHLKDLYTRLLAPVIEELSVRHLLIVPHDLLHHVPFHALWDGEQYLMERFSISYAQSASVYYLSATKVTHPEERSLILGVPDDSAPSIAQEAREVASYLPDPRLYVGEEATAQRLRAEAPTSRFVHIATHGLFRQSNPMFSSIRLADSRLSLFDLYHLSLSAELVTLSRCATGLNVVEGGDELLGLARGLFYAGAQSVLLTLWDVNDRSTAEFMTRFYGRLQAAPGERAEALQAAMLDMKELYPHPYYWAPFALMGKFRS